MLIELFGQNFRCFRDEFRLSLEATRLDPGDDRGVVSAAVEGEPDPLRLLRALAIYGSNASGKSTILSAAAALRYLIVDTPQAASSVPILVYEPFALDAQRDAPTTLGMRALVAGVVFEYVVSFDRARITREVLRRLSGGGARGGVTLFDRSGQEVDGDWATDEQFTLLRKGMRESASLLGLADRFAPGLAQGIAVALADLLRSREPIPSWGAVDRADRVAQRVADDQRFSDWLMAHLRAADVGVVDLTVEEVVRTVVSRRPRGETEPEADSPETRISRRLALLHQGAQGPVQLPFRRESLGTQRVVDLAFLLYDLAEGDGARAAFVDEIDTSLHPTLLEGLVRHFNSEMGATSRCQLVFTTHETALLDDEAKSAVLRRDQVYFTEKDANGAARLYSLAEFKERNNLNVRKRYLQGRYGALPSIGQLPE